MKQTTPNPYVYSPPEGADALHRYVETVYRTPLLDWGCDVLDDGNLSPQLPGQLTALVARPSNGKTSFLIYKARHEGERIVSLKQRDKCVVYITWEEPVESIELSLQAGKRYTSEDLAFGRVKPELVLESLPDRVNLPIYVLGKSVTRRQEESLPPMYLSTVRTAIESIKYEWGLQPSLILGDYIQKVPVKGDKDRVKEVTEAIFGFKELLLDIQCPGMLGVQAGRDVDMQGLPIPTLGSAQWASAIEQEADRMLGLLRPITVSNARYAGQPPREIEIDGTAYVTDPSLLVMRLLKQRLFTPRQMLYVLDFDPARFTLAYRPPEGRVL